MARLDFSSICDRAELQNAPIHPDWILEGAPHARNLLVAGSTDRAAWTMLWDCSAGKFLWRYDEDETIHVIEGGVTITVDSKATTLKVGDVAFLPAGTIAHWHVEHYIRKVAFCQRPAPALIAYPMHVLRRIKAHAAKGLALVSSSLREPMPEKQTAEAQAPAAQRLR